MVRLHTPLMSHAPSDVGARPGSRIAVFVIPLVGAGTLLPFVSAGLALLAGIGAALLLGNPWPEWTRTTARRLLTWSVVGLGAGMNLAVVLRVGLHGVAYTVAGIGAALFFGTLLGRRIGVDRDTSLLVTVGTAICGGSAIAAVAPGINARDNQVSVALVTVFLLNALALFIFPLIGHGLHLQQDAFGLWCALAIHDTSSVVGAAASYGERALEVATATKLARALWIVPVTFALATFRVPTRRMDGPAAGAPRRPWFIAGLLLAAALVTFVPSLRAAGALVSIAAHRSLAATLFLMGLGLTRATLRSVGYLPLLQGAVLWIGLAAATLGAIVLGWIA